MHNLDFEEEMKKAVTLNEREQIRNFVQSLEEEYQQRQSSSSAQYTQVLKVRFRWMVGMAASFLILAMLGAYLFLDLGKSGGTEIAKQYFEPYPNTYKPITRGGADQDALELKGLISYERGDYDSAMIYFNQIDSPNDHIQMFLAISEYQVGNIDQAMDRFSKLAAEKDSSLALDAKWYLALCYIRMDEKDEAISYLHEIVEENHGQLAQKAQSLLKILSH